MTVAILGDSKDAQQLGAALAEISGLSAERWCHSKDFIHHLQHEPLLGKKYQLVLLDSDQTLLSDLISQFSSAPIFYFHASARVSGRAPYGLTEQVDAILRLLEESDLVEYQGLFGKQKFQ